MKLVWVLHFLVLAVFAAGVVKRDALQQNQKIFALIVFGIYWLIVGIVSIVKFIKKKKAAHQNEQLFKNLHNEIAENRRKNILAEFINTEISYVFNLKIIVKVFLHRIRGSTKQILSPSTTNAIFSDIESIWETNQTFLDELMNLYNQHNEAEVLRQIQNFAHAFKLYIPYMQNHASATSVLTEESKTNEKFAAFLKNTQQLLREYKISDINLQSLLIMPIQRVPRYRLLLEQYLKEIEPTSKLYAPAKEALSNIIEVASYLNQKLRESEKQKRQSEIGTRLSGSLPLLLKEGRVFLADAQNVEVTLKQTSKKQALNESAHCYVFSGLLVIEFSKKEKHKKDEFIPIELPPAGSPQEDKSVSSYTKEATRVIMNMTAPFSTKYGLESITITLRSEEIFKEFNNELCNVLSASFK